VAEIQVPGPTADDDPLREVGDAQTGIARRGALPGQDGGKGDPPGRVAGLGEGHRAHPQVNEPAGARVAGRVVARDGGPCQDELALVLSPVDRVADLVPKIRFDLPFVDEAGGRAVKQQPRVGSERLARGRRVDPHLAAHGVAAGLRLADGPRALEDYGTHGVQRRGELGVDQARSVVHVAECRLRRALTSIARPGIAVGPDRHLQQHRTAICRNSRPIAGDPCGRVAARDDGAPPCLIWLGIVASGIAVRQPGSSPATRRGNSMILTRSAASRTSRARRRPTRDLAAASAR